MKTFKGMLGGITLSAILVVALFAYASLNGLIGGGDRTIIVNLPTTSPAAAVETRIAEFTATPGVHSEGVAPTLMPYTERYQGGDGPGLEAALKKVFATAGLDLRVSSVNTYGNSGIYCGMTCTMPAGYTMETFINDPDPLPNKIVRGDTSCFKRTLYCVSYLGLGELWGGVPQADLQNLEWYQDESRVIDPNERTITTVAKTVHVKVKARFGLLTESEQELAVEKKTLEDPNGILMEGIEWLVNVANPQSPQDWTVWRDYYDSLALGLFKRNMKSPENLALLQQAIVTQFNQPSPDPNVKWPYDSLFVQVNELARAYGYESATLEVVIVWPNEPGVWYYLQDLDTAPKMVNGPEADFPYRHNLWPMFKAAIEGNPNAVWVTQP